MGQRKLKIEEKRKKGQQKIQNNEGEEEEKLYIYIFVSHSKNCLKGFKFCPYFKHDYKKLGLQVLKLV